MKEFKDYLKEIEFLKKKFKLNPIQILTLQLMASFETSNLDYNKLKKQFCKSQC